MTVDNVARSFGYSLANRLTSSSFPGLGTVTLGYDAQGRLSHYNGGIDTRIAYDGADRIVEQDASGAILGTHVHGPGADEPLVTYEGGKLANRRWLHADEGLRRGGGVKDTACAQDYRFGGTGFRGDRHVIKLGGRPRHRRSDCASRRSRLTLATRYSARRAGPALGTCLPAFR